MADAAVTRDCLLFREGYFSHVCYYVPREVPLRIWVNGQHWLTIMCTPTAQKELVLGLAFFNGLITGLEDVLSLEHCQDDQTTLRLQVRGDVAISSPRIHTSGCGQGLQPLVELALRKVPSVDPKLVYEVPELMRQLWRRTRAGPEMAGLHVSALSCGGDWVTVQADIGRHNTIDKIMGYCMLWGVDPRGGLLLTSGRVSSEMALKAVQMGVSMVASRTTPTDLAVALARQWNLALIGYVRGREGIIYSGPWLEGGIEIMSAWGTDFITREDEHE